MHIGNALARLNDEFRSTLTVGDVLLTKKAARFGERKLTQVLELIRTFEFTEENDPHHMRDFMLVDCGEETWLARILCMAPNLRGPSLDPADPERTVRRMLIMRAAEYTNPA